MPTPRAWRVVSPRRRAPTSGSTISSSGDRARRKPKRSAAALADRPLVARHGDEVEAGSLEGGDENSLRETSRTDHAEAGCAGADGVDVAAVRRPWSAVTWPLLLYSSTIPSGDSERPDQLRISFLGALEGYPLADETIRHRSCRLQRAQETIACFGPRSSERSRSDNQGRVPRTRGRTARGRTSATDAGQALCRRKAREAQSCRPRRSRPRDPGRGTGRRQARSDRCFPSKRRQSQRHNRLRRLAGAAPDVARANPCWTDPALDRALDKERRDIDTDDGATCSAQQLSA